MNDVIWKLVVIFFGSTVKYSWSSLLAATSDVGLFPAFIVNVAGGVSGILVFSYFGQKLRSWAEKKFAIRRNEKPGMINRIVQFFKKRFGLAGIAFLAPVLLSLPVGVGLMCSFSNDRKKIILYMIISCLFWSCIILLPFYFFHVDVLDWSERKMHLK